MDEYINYGSIDGWTSKLEGLNNDMKNELQTIQKKITSLQGDLYESKDARTIREKINGMTPRFEQYYDVVSNYVTFLRRAKEEYMSTEAANDSNAKQFI